jgi:hypothetical protein
MARGTTCQRVGACWMPGGAREHRGGGRGMGVEAPPVASIDRAVKSAAISVV